MEGVSGNLDFDQKPVVKNIFIEDLKSSVVLNNSVYFLINSSSWISSENTTLLVRKKDSVIQIMAEFCLPNEYTSFNYSGKLFSKSGQLIVNIPSCNKVNFYDTYVYEEIE